MEKQNGRIKLNEFKKAVDSIKEDRELAYRRIKKTILIGIILLSSFIVWMIFQGITWYKITPAILTVIIIFFIITDSLEYFSKKKLLEIAKAEALKNCKQASYCHCNTDLNPITCLNQDNPTDCLDQRILFIYQAAIQSLDDKFDFWNYTRQQA